MPDKAWKLSHNTWTFFSMYYYGLCVVVSRDPGRGVELHVTLNLGPHNHSWHLRKELDRLEKEEGDGEDV